VSNQFHKNLVEDDIHAAVARIYDDITARDADTDFQVTENINKIVRVDSPLTFYALASVSPTVWLEFPSTFLGLLDTPSSYTSQSFKVIRVNSGEDGLEFSAVGTILAMSFGEMIEDNPAGSPVNSTTENWITASAGLLDSNSLVTFSDQATGDRLVIETGASGIYFVNFTTNFTNDGGNETTATIHVNDVEQTNLKAVHPGDSSSKNNLSGAGFLSLSDADFITFNVVSSTPSDVVELFQCNVNIQRMS